MTEDLNSRVADSAPRVLVLGRKGQIATELADTSWPAEWQVTCLGRDNLDITRPDAVRQAVNVLCPDLVVNAAAYTAVDAAEIDAQQAFAVNSRGAASVAAACAALDIPLIHLSTDFVFDGAAQHAYREDDPVNPLSVYGASKEAGERAVRNALRRHVILRTSWVYGPHGSNFVKTLLRYGPQQAALSVVDDQTGCPTAAADVARAVAIIARQLLDGRDDAFGTYHFCGRTGMTWYRFAAAVLDRAAEAGLAVPRLYPIATADRPLPAPRPRWSVLDCRRIAEVFGIEARSWHDALAETFLRLMPSAVPS
jgi:dTDP-4-dehydrorhamnose reductase